MDLVSTTPACTMRRHFAFHKLGQGVFFSIILPHLVIQTCPLQKPCSVAERAGQLQLGSARFYNYSAAPLAHTTEIIYVYMYQLRNALSRRLIQYFSSRIAYPIYSTVRHAEIVELCPILSGHPAPSSKVPTMPNPRGPQDLWMLVSLASLGLSRAFHCLQQLLVVLCFRGSGRCCLLPFVQVHWTSQSASDPVDDAGIRTHIVGASQWDCYGLIDTQYE